MIMTNCDVDAKGQIYVEEEPVRNSEKLSYEKGNFKLCSCRLFVKKMNCPKYISPVFAVVETAGEGSGMLGGGPTPASALRDRLQKKQYLQIF